MNKDCPVCGCGDIQDILDIPGVPVLCNVRYRTRRKALAAPRGDIRLGFCGECGHLFNRAFDPDRVRYTADYDNALHFSPRFGAYAENLARRLIERYGIRGRNVIDIGCGTGEFLSLICRLGENRGVGFEPRAAATSAGGEDPGRIRMVPDTYSGKYGRTPVDLACCRHVLEHVPDPRGFIGTIYQNLRSRGTPVLYVEVPNADHMLARGAVWDVIYEHVSYFGSASLSRLLGGIGFHIACAEACYGGQYLSAEALATGFRPRRPPPAQACTPGETARLARHFSGTYEEAVGAWRTRLESLQSQGKKAVVWGAGSKGVSFLNAMIGFGDVAYAVDINPGKARCHVPGSGERIVPPEYLLKEPPDAILVMNPLYRRDIRLRAARLGVECTVLAV